MKAKGVMKPAALTAMSFLCFGVVNASAESAVSENKFDVLAKTLGPYLALGTPSGSAGNHAVKLEATAVEVTGLPPEFKGAHVRVAYQFPDKLLVQVPSGQTTITVCRKGQDVWAAPGPLVSLLLERLREKKASKPFPAFRLTEAAAALLPALFDVHDAGNVALGPQKYRVLDVRLLSLKKTATSPWFARLWIVPETHRAAQIALHSPAWSATFSVDKVDFAPALPPETWVPAPEEQPQIVHISQEKIAALLELAIEKDERHLP